MLSASKNRVRTVLNEKQLHTLRTCYQANPRPDALMKEQLVEMTGLSPRVIRVWFQNKRCKDKKKQIMIKQLEEQRHNQDMLDSNHDELKSIASCKAVSLVAGDPQAAGGGDNHHRTTSGGSGGDIKLESEVEIKSYQQDWKNMPTHLNYRHDDNSLQQLVSSFSDPLGSHSSVSDSSPCSVTSSTSFGSYLT